MNKGDPSLQQQADDGRTTRLHDLTDALLEQVFAFVCFGDVDILDKTTYSPYRWNRVYTCSTTLWSQLHMDWRRVLERLLVQGGPPLIPAFGYVTKWVLNRAPYVRDLCYAGCGELGPTLDQQLYHICREGGRLRRVQLLDATDSGDGLLRQLGTAQRLQEIVLRCQGSVEGPLQSLLVSTSALGALSMLSTLRDLDLRVDRVVGSVQDVGSALQGLTSLRFEGRQEALVLQPEMLHTMTNLVSLQLGNCRLGQFTPRTSEALSHLTHLGATDLLAARPKKKAGITLWVGLRHLESLQSLKLQEQQSGGMPGNALECRRLRGLTLIQTAADSWPSWGHLAVHPNCLPVLEELHLEEVVLEPSTLSHQLWPSLVSLTKLVWREVRQVPSDRPVPHVMTQVQALPPPPGISSLCHLQHLRLEYCQLDQVPPCIYPLSNLKRLSLKGNSIQDLPPESYLAGLEHLSLAANQVRKLPEGLCECRALCTLCLARNSDLNLRPWELDALTTSCRQLRRVWVTECNGLEMGLLGYHRLEGEGAAFVTRQELSNFMVIQHRFPGLIAWGDGRSAWVA